MTQHEIYTFPVGMRIYDEDGVLQDPLTSGGGGIVRVLGDETSGYDVTAQDNEVKVTGQAANIDLNVVGITVTIVGGKYFKVIGLPTADPHIIHTLWSDAGTLKISAG